MITDPISDSLTRIRNALSSRHKTVEIRYSKFVKSIVMVLFRIGYVETVSTCRFKSGKYISIGLKYDTHGVSVIHGLKRISKPSIRRYCKAKDIPIVYNGIGTALISTSKGLMTSYKARKEGIGGEVIFFIW